MKVRARRNILNLKPITESQINPMDVSNAAKNKSKDIHLPSIDVNFGSNRIL